MGRRKNCGAWLIGSRCRAAGFKTGAIFSALLHGLLFAARGGVHAGGGFVPHARGAAEFPGYGGVGLKSGQRNPLS
jgi:hypothetical protein